MTEVLGHKRYSVIHEQPFINPSLQAGAPARPYPGFSPDGTQRGFLLASVMFLNIITLMNIKPSSITIRAKAHFRGRREPQPLGWG